MIGKRAEKPTIKGAVPDEKAQCPQPLVDLSYTEPEDVRSHQPVISHWNDLYKHENRITNIRKLEGCNKIGKCKYDVQNLGIDVSTLQNKGNSDLYCRKK